MIFGEGPIIKNIAGDLNKLFLQGTRAGQPINNVEGDAAADQGTIQLMADRDPVIRDISTGLGWAGREVAVSGTGALQLVNSLGRPLKSWSVELSPYQEGSGDPSPENVRPIYGSNRLTMWIGGANMLPTTATGRTYAGITYTVNPDGSVRVQGTSTSISWLNAGAPTTHVPAGTYTISGGSSDTGLYIVGTFADGTTINNITIGGADTGTGRTFTLNQDCYIYWQISVGAGKTVDIVVYPMMAVGTSIIEFTPYSAPSQTVINLPQTVYNGTVGSDGGVSRMSKIVLDGTQTGISANWRSSANSVGVLYPYSITNNKTPLYDSDLPNILSETLPTITYADAYAMRSDEAISSVSHSDRWGFCVRLPDPTLTTVELVNQYLAAHPITAVYELNTPIDFAITTPVIPTIEGDGSIWITAEDGIITSFSATYLQSE